MECTLTWNVGLITLSINDNLSTFHDEFSVDYECTETSSKLIIHTTTQRCVFRSYSSLEMAVKNLIGKIKNLSSIKSTEPEELSASVLIMTKPEEEGLEKALTKREEEMIQEGESDNEFYYSVEKNTINEDASERLHQHDRTTLIDVKQALQKLGEIPLVDYYIIYIEII